jgi:CPA1 family monovalent cation:H+ antiporter
LRQLRRDLIAVEAAELTRLYREGTIGAGVRRQLQRRLDLEETSLGD